MIKHRIFEQMNCFRFANVVNKTRIINTFNSDNRNIANIKTKHCKIMTTITNRILKFELKIKKPIVTDNAFFTVITFRNIISLA